MNNGYFCYCFHHASAITVTFIVLLILVLVPFHLNQLAFANSVATSVNGARSIGVNVISRSAFLILTLAARLVATGLVTSGAIRVPFIDIAQFLIVLD